MAPVTVADPTSTSAAGGETYHEPDTLSSVPPKPTDDVQIESTAQQQGDEHAAHDGSTKAASKPVLPEPHHGILTSIVEALKHDKSSNSKHADKRDGTTEQPIEPIISSPTPRRQDGDSTEGAAIPTEGIAPSKPSNAARAAPRGQITIPQPSQGNAEPTPSSPDHITMPPSVVPDLARASNPANMVGGSPAVHAEEGAPSGKIPVAAARTVERVDTLADLPSHTSTQRSRRNSFSDRDAGKVKAPPMPLPGRSIKSQSASTDRRSGLSAPTSAPSSAPQPAQRDAGAETVVLFAGEQSKPHVVHRSNLMNKSPFFADLLRDGATPEPAALTFSDMDEHGFGLFTRWISGGQLYGPTDFQTLSHYLALYCAALRFAAIPLQDETMDLCRAYYRHNNMTAPAYRLEYIYTFAPGPNLMRDFLVSTAAYRCLCGDPTVPGPYLTQSMRSLLSRQGELAPDFAEALIKLSRDGLVDVRHGADEVWHVGGGAASDLPEPWQT